MQAAPDANKMRRLHVVNIKLQWRVAWGLVSFRLSAYVTIFAAVARSERRERRCWCVRSRKVSQTRGRRKL